MPPDAHTELQYGPDGRCLDCCGEGGCHSLDCPGMSEHARSLALDAVSAEHPAAQTQSMTEIALDTRVKLLRAELVADHWRKAYLEWGDQQMPARIFAHGLCCVLSALQGDTSEPTALGVEPESKEGLHLAQLAETE